VTSKVNRNLERLFLEQTVKAVNDISEPWKTSDTGRPPHEPEVVAVMCVLKIKGQRTYESTEAYGRDNNYLKRLLGVDRLPTQSVIHRGMQRMPPGCIKKLNQRLTVRFRRKGIEGITDASGFRLRTSSSWYDIRIQRKSRRKDHLKLHIIGDFQTGIIHSFSVTGGREGDSPQFRKMILVIGKVLKMAGDSAYMARKNCTLVRDRGGTPYFRLKVNVTAKPKSHPEWKAMVKLYHKDPKAWLKEYHIRSYVEAIFASIKHRFGNFLRSIKPANQEKELSLKVICYNVVRVLYLKCAKELGVPLWVKVKQTKPG